jgi:glycosyltransferase involved in cell wall biosynthesis
MKIMHLLCSSHFSGAENVVCQIIDLFSGDDRIEMIYCSPNGPIEDYLKRNGIAFYGLKKMSMREVKRAIDFIKPDLIHAHDMRASFYATRASKKVPVISHIHNNALDSRRLSLKSITYAFCSKKISHIFWVSNEAMEGYKFSNLLSKKSSVLQNIINCEKIYNLVDEDQKSYSFDLVYVGRITKIKNPHRLISICSRLVAEKEDIRIAIVGSGDMYNEIHDSATELNLLGNIEFFGFVRNPYKIIMSSKCMIMTSIYEGLPMVALEGMCLGVPLVSTPVDGLKSVIINGYNGYLSDSDDEIVKNILNILDDNALFNYLHKNQLELSQKMNNIDVYYKNILDVYVKTVGEKI